MTPAPATPAWPGCCIRPDIIKADRVLVQDIDRDPARRAMLTGFVTLADQTGLTLIAEGIERPEELAVLTELGIGYGQGFLLARPAPLPIPLTITTT